MYTDIRYSIVVPVYNEEVVIEETYRRLKQVMDQTGEPYELIFVDDGSRDGSAKIIKRLGEQDATVKLLSLSRNFGHQIAITAGMDYASGEAVVVIDADLQDPPELIPAMIAQWQEGYEVVYATRTNRKGETFFKKQSASLFYRLLRTVTEVDIPVDAGDFRLLDRKVCEQLKRMPEKNRYVRGLVSWVGFRQTAIEYERDPRLAGETKYSVKKMFKLSMDGLTSFSLKPIKLASSLGVIMVAGSLVYMAGTHVTRFGRSLLDAWHTMLAVQFLLSGIFLLMLGLVGEYIGRIYDEVRARPLYIVDECYGLKPKDR